MRSCFHRCWPGPRRRAGALTDIERITTVFVVTGHDQSELEQAMEPVRQQIAFYASTPDYAAVLELHGWDFAEKLRGMSRRGEWGEMAAIIPDEMVAEVAVIAPIDELAPRSEPDTAIACRGLVTTRSTAAPPGPRRNGPTSSPAPAAEPLDRVEWQTQVGRSP